MVSKSNWTEVATAVKAVKGVSDVAPEVIDPRSGIVKEVNGKIVLDATLNAPADSREARETIPDIRKAVHAIEAGALVGGISATYYDVDEASRHDRNLVIPIVLFIIALILAFLLRSVVAAVVLLVTVILSFVATLGASAFVFNHIFKFAGADTSFPLFTFVFLVALGIDYNIFLMTRVREESLKLGTRAGTIEAVS